MLFRIWWVLQVGMPAFASEVRDLVEAKVLLDTIDAYDAFQFEQKIKPKSWDLGGLEMFDPEDEDWYEWYEERNRQGYKTLFNNRVRAVSGGGKIMTIPNSFQFLNVPLPPMLLEMAGVKGDSQFVALFYSGSKATWNDARSSATFPFYAVWQPYIDHTAIAIDLFDCNLGADDETATHALVCDRANEKVYASPFAEAMSFVSEQHPPRQELILTQEQWSEIKAQLEAQSPLSMEEMQELGMFELFAPNPKHKEKAIELIRWLDGYIDEPLLRRYVVAATAGDKRAAWGLEMFKRRCQQ